MSHREQLEYLSEVARANQHLVMGGRILEIGSYNVNGTMRQAFAGASEYIGVDLVDGPGVDIVSFGHEVEFPDASFDLAVSGECFEHDPHWSETFLSMIKATRPGGVVAFTCASKGRPEHGTRRTDATWSPGTQWVGLDYYRNLSEVDFKDALDLADFFDRWQFSYMRTSFDLYFTGVRRATPHQRDPIGALPDPSTIASIRRATKLRQRFARLPLTTADRILPDDRYQDFAIRYVKSVRWLRSHRVTRTRPTGQFV